MFLWLRQFVEGKKCSSRTPKHTAQVTSGAPWRPEVTRWRLKGSFLVLGQGQGSRGQSLSCQPHPALGLELINRIRVCACLGQTINETFTFSPVTRRYIPNPPLSVGKVAYFLSTAIFSLILLFCLPFYCFSGRSSLITPTQSFFISSIRYTAFLGIKTELRVCGFLLLSLMSACKSAPH